MVNQIKYSIKQIKNKLNYLATPLYLETPRENPLLFLQIKLIININ